MKETIILWLVGVVTAAFVVAAACSYIDGSAECERKGGAYFCPRGSSCICLAPGVVLP